MQGTPKYILLSGRAFRVMSLSMVVTVSLASASVGQANSVSGGNTWHGTWGFQSSNQESLALSRSRLIEEKRSGGLGADNSFVTYDNRSNFVEIGGSNSGTIENSNRNGDEIGRNTNVVGSMNTGENRVEVVGNNNVLDVFNEASSSGCLDGSINEAISQNTPSGVSAIASALREAGEDGNTANSLSQASTAGGFQSECLQ